MHTTCNTILHMLTVLSASSVQHAVKQLPALQDAHQELQAQVQEVRKVKTEMQSMQVSTVTSL